MGSSRHQLYDYTGAVARRAVLYIMLLPLCCCCWHLPCHSCSLALHLNPSFPLPRSSYQARSPVFRALLTGPMREGHQSSIDIQDVRAPVFRALLYFAYTDSLPEDLQVECGIRLCCLG